MFVDVLLRLFIHHILVNSSYKCCFNLQSNLMQRPGHPSFGWVESVVDR